MSLQNLEAMEKFQENGKKNEYLNKLKNLIAQIRNGDAIWADVLDLREQYGMPYMTLDTVRRSCGIYDEFNSAGWVSAPKNTTMGAKEVNSLNSDGSRTSEKLIELSEDEINSRESLLKAHGFNPVYFELVSAKTSKWQQGDGKGGLKNLYSSKITVKPIENGIDLEEVNKHFENFKSRPVKLNDYSKNDDGYLVINFADLHIGRTRYEAETGNAFNLDIAEDMVRKITKGFLSRYQNRHFKQIVLCIGNDVMNSAANGYTTSGKHQQSNCASFKEIFDRTCEIMINVIDSFKEVAPVLVVHTEGNHDRNESYMFGKLLEAYYRNDENVGVDALPTTRKYVRLGNNLIGFSHGSEEGKRIYSLMQQERPEDWAYCSTRVWLLRHEHHLVCNEENGVDVWTCPSPTGSDTWTAKTGYISQRRVAGFVFNKISGLEEVHFVYV